MCIRDREYGVNVFFPLRFRELIPGGHIHTVNDLTGQSAVTGADSLQQGLVCAGRAAEMCIRDRSMAMKVLYEKESLRLLGAQIVGGDGVDKRIDVLATAIRAKMTALELTELDLSYAPPYSSAKDLSLIHI